MKQVIQNQNTGKLSLVDVPAPQAKKDGLLVRIFNSAVSVGTEKLIISSARQNLFEKIISRPELVRRLINKIRTEGFKQTYLAIREKPETLHPLGYSSAGEVIAVGEEVVEFKIGDKVACGGDLFATHSEITWVPKNNCVKIPVGVESDVAAFAYIAAISIYAVRCANLAVGSRVVVIGLGLLGQITVQVLKAWGCEAFGYDLDKRKADLSVELGARDGASERHVAIAKAKNMTNGQGFDATIIMASSPSNDPLELSAEITRERGKIVACGLVKLDVPRNVFFDKELSLIVPRAAGPNASDNMKEYFSLVANRKIDINKLITHRFKIDDALKAYDLILNKQHPYYLGVLLEYKPDSVVTRKLITNPDNLYPKGQPVVGLIGAGLFPNVVILPGLKKIKGVSLRGVSTATGTSGNHAARQHGFSYCTTDYNEILQDPQINTVIIATRHDLHGRMIIESLHAGKDVFVEKPLTITQEEVKAISEVYKKSGKRLMVGFNRRFSPFAVRAKELMGEVGAVTVNCRVNAGFVPKSHWSLNREGGGRVIGEVCHFIDFIQYVTSSIPVRVFAEGMSEDNIALTIKMKNGSVGSVLYTSVGHQGIPRERIEVFGNKQGYIIDDFTRMEFVRDGKKEKMKSWKVDRGHQNELKIFFGCLKESLPIPVDFNEYIYTTVATFAIMESLASCRPVNIHIDYL